MLTCGDFTAVLRAWDKVSMRAAINVNVKRESDLMVGPVKLMACLRGQR